MQMLQSLKTQGLKKHTCVLIFDLHYKSFIAGHNNVIANKSFLRHLTHKTVSYSNGSLEYTRNAGSDPTFRRPLIAPHSLNRSGFMEIKQVPCLVKGDEDTQHLNLNNLFFFRRQSVLFSLAASDLQKKQKGVVSCDMLTLQTKTKAREETLSVALLMALKTACMLQIICILYPC